VTDIITIKDLEDFKGLSAELEALQRERQWAYFPVASPNGRENEGARGNTPSDPTANALRKIDLIDRRIAEKQDEIAERLSAILDWLDTVEDSEIRAIVHWHYLQGLDWQKTNLKVYGYKSYQACRKRIMRYFGREK
jgi:hypothetical protein